MSQTAALYERIANHLEIQIRKGALAAGERIPSVRSMSELEKVSVSTVIQAYLLLESRGLIESKPQSGFYVRMPEAPVFPTPETIPVPSARTNVAVSELVTTIYGAARHPSVVPLGAGIPDAGLFPWNKLNRIQASILRENPHHSAAYEFPPGHEGLRRQIARHYTQAGAELTASEIIITTGGMEAIIIALRATTEPGDTVLIESPTYFGILQAIESLGLRGVEIPCCSKIGICIDDVKKALNRHKIKAALLNVTFNNPTGALVPDAVKKELVGLLSSRGIPIIEDDIYGDTAFDGSRPKMLKAFDPDGWVLTCSSFSKTIAPGYRVGWIAPGRYFKKAEMLKFTTTIATASLPQQVLAEYFSGGNYERYLRKLRAALSEQVRKTTHSIFTHFPNGTKVSRPLGGFMLWVELPSAVDSIDLHRRALQHKISIAPGPIFSASGQYRNYVRLNCGNIWSPKIERAISCLGKLIQNRKP